LKFENAGKLFFFSNQRISTETTNFPLIKKAGSISTISDNYALSETGAVNELAKLSIGEQKNLFGIIRIHLKGNSSGLNVTTAQNKIRNPYQVFEMVFENRKTTWRYIFNEDQLVKNKDDVKKESGNSRQLITKKKYPLTTKGFISIEHGGVELPNPDAMLIKPNSTNNKIYSEIYM